MSANKTRFLLVTLLALVGILAMIGQRPVSAALVPVSDGSASVASLSASLQVTATATLTATKTLTPTVAAATATKTVTPTVAAATVTKTVTPTVAAATATKTVTPTVAAATATKTVTPTVAAATATKTVTPTVAVATATKTATRAPATATKTATPAPTKTATTAARLGPRAGTVSSLSTQFVVQNMDASTTANVTGTFYDASGSSTGTNAVNATIPPNRNAIIDQRGSGGGLDSQTSWQGSVVLSSNTALAAIVSEFAGNAGALGPDFRSDSYNGIGSSQAAASALLPQVLKNVTDGGQNKTYNSTIAIQNTSPTGSALVTITYTNLFAPSDPPQVHSNISIPPGSSALIDMQNETTWPSFFGPANVTSNQNIGVIVNQNAAGSLLIYRGFTPADGSNSLLVTQALTSVFDQGQQLNYGSAIEGMSVNGTSTTVTVDYTNLLGGSKSCTLPAGTTFRIDMRPGNWPASCTPPVNAQGQFFGTLRLTASGGASIVALSNLQSDYSASKGIRSSTSRAFVTTGGLATAFAPLLMNGYLDQGTGVTWGTAIEGQFLSGTGTVNITYYTSTGGTFSDTYTAGPDQIFRFDQRSANVQTGFTLPSGTLASAVLSSSAGSFVFTVNAQGASSTLGDALTVYQSQ